MDKETKEKTKNERVMEITKALDELGYKVCEFRFVKSQCETSEASEYREPLISFTVNF